MGPKTCYTCGLSLKMATGITIIVFGNNNVNNDCISLIGQKKFLCHPYQLLSGALPKSHWLQIPLTLSLI
jgi:hypothetical protein